MPTATLQLLLKCDKRLNTAHKKSNHPLTQMIAPNFTMKNLSGYSDSNGGPPAPKAGALSQLRHTPNPLKGLQM
jgi:hypothetical protein